MFEMKSRNPRRFFLCHNWLFACCKKSFSQPIEASCSAKILHLYFARCIYFYVFRNYLKQRLSQKCFDRFITNRVCIFCERLHHWTKRKTLKLPNVYRFLYRIENVVLELIRNIPFLDMEPKFAFWLNLHCPPPLVSEKVFLSMFLITSNLVWKVGFGPGETGLRWKQVSDKHYSIVKVVEMTIKT